MSNFKYTFALLCTIFSSTFSMNLQNELLNAINNLDTKKVSRLLQQSASVLTAQDRRIMFGAIDNHPNSSREDHSLEGPYYIIVSSGILWAIFYWWKEQKVPVILSQKDAKDFDVFLSYFEHYGTKGLNVFKKSGKYIFGTIAAVTALYMIKEIIAGGYDAYLNNKHSSINNLFTTKFPARS
ncbi:hypothetical protein M1446_02710 [Candidatus Dependentiae bacterium]|nr:hypothetical protein [Candidatus Dependentiae bacterium]